MMTDNSPNAAQLPQGVARLWSHIVDLGALQCRLFAVEFRRSSASLRTAMLLTIVGGVLFLAATPLLLFAAALQLHATAELSVAASLAIVAGIALLLVLPALAVANRLARESVSELTSPVRDLEVNLRALTGEEVSNNATPAGE